MKRLNNVINIRYGQSGPAGGLSNLYPRPFVFRGINCGSVEGVLRGMQFQSQQVQHQIAKLYGHKARRAGTLETSWHDTGLFYWNGKSFNRFSDEYQDFLDELYVSAFTQNNEAKNFLLSTKDAKLIHTVGHTNPNETILTVKEFCGRLTEIRKILKASKYIEF